MQFKKKKKILKISYKEHKNKTLIVLHKYVFKETAKQNDEKQKNKTQSPFLFSIFIFLLVKKIKI